MEYIKYNKNILSKLSLGTVQFGLNYGISNKIGKPAQEEVNEIINFLEINGINSFDTAKGYGDSEIVLGNYFKNKQNIQKYIVSKFESQHLQLEEKDFLIFIKDSLKKLNINSLFGLLMHNSDFLDKWEKYYSCKVSVLKDQGIIKYFGVSIYSNKEFELALNNKDIDIIQVPFNIMDQRAHSRSWLKKAKENNKLIFIRSIYLQGLLLMNIEDIPKKLEDAKEDIKYIDNIANSLGISRNELCLSFVNTIARDAVILFGCETLEQAKENIKVFNSIKKLDKNIIDKLINRFIDLDEKIYNPTKW